MQISNFFKLENTNFFMQISKIQIIFIANALRIAHWSARQAARPHAKQSGQQLAKSRSLAKSPAIRPGLIRSNSGNSLRLAITQFWAQDWAK